jgi:pimeloyl-ACP methyl ester carboxylesterase
MAILGGVMRRKQIVAVMLTAAALAALPLVAIPAAEAAPPGTAGASLTWRPCPKPPPEITAVIGTPPPFPKFECAKVSVPLDYRHPHGRHIKIAVSRMPSTSPRQRRGVLNLQCGGPGGACLFWPVLISELAPRQVLDSYDLIGFDPRGVGHSAPVTCHMTARQANLDLSWPLPGGVKASAAEVRRVAHQCATSSTAGELPFITTANTARDMDRIRQALGVAKISYQGYSYGTYLGAVYATMFPRHTGRVVLDSSTDANRVWYDSGFRAFGPGAQIRFPDFAKFVAANNATYGLGSSPAKITKLYFSLAAGLDHHPLATPDGPLSGNTLRSITFNGLYSDQSFPAVAALWKAAVDRSGSAAAATGLLPSRTIDAFEENQVAAGIAVVCDDASWPRSVAVYERNVRHDASRYPIAGAMAANIHPCAFWPNNPLAPPVRVVPRRGTKNILLINNLRDPATPYFGAQALRRELGQRAEIVGVDQGGHGVWLVTPNACGNAAVNNFLVHGSLPARGTICPADAASAGATPARPSRGEQLTLPTAGLIGGW